MTDLEKAEMLLAKARFPFLPMEARRIKIIKPTSLDPERKEWFEWLPITEIDLHEKHRFGGILSVAMNNDIRFLADFPWPYPPETRDGVPVWARLIEHDYTGEWDFFYSADDAKNAVPALDIDSVEIVAADPRNLQKEPPK